MDRTLPHCYNIGVVKITIKATGFELTSSLTAYIEEKLGALARLVAKYEATGQPEMWVEVGRTTRHHHKGPVFRAEADLRLPQNVLRAEQSDVDLRAAIDKLKIKLRLEIEKYKTRTSPRARRKQ